ncbi:uncharacterized protein LOC132310443 [Cornus florida]|uniref:uncharacterized protein LOC132310443 n=1 Tax=Cornus florida TaxID=4283 RepID=UPI00289937D4|nr:uncharacterized protein LOC132310443 [Cornus florida]
MGNCSVKGVTDIKCSNSIRLMTDSGDIIELEGPKIVREVLNDFPGYGIFRQGRLSSPLLCHQQLFSNRFYYLLPLGKEMLAPGTKASTYLNDGCANVPEPVRMSSSSAALDVVTNLTNGSALEVLPPPQKGVWRVKLVIGTKQLEEILSGEDNTEALIETMRMAASSANVTPRRIKGSRGVNWKILSNFFKVPVDYEKKVR